MLLIVPVVLLFSDISGLPLASTNTSPSTVTVANTTIDPQGSPTGLSLPASRCELYRSGHVCDSWLADRTVFVEREFPQEFMNNYTSRILRFAPDGNTECRQLVQEALCKYALPRCTTTKAEVIEKAHLCSHNCHALERCKEYIFELVFNVAADSDSPDLFEDSRRFFGLVTLQRSCRPDRIKLLPKLRPQASDSCLELQEGILHGICCLYV